MTKSYSTTATAFRFGQLPSRHLLILAHMLRVKPHKRSLGKQNDDFYISEIRLIWLDSKCRYGVRKVWQQLKANGLEVARCTVERLMRQYELQGVWRGKNKVTTKSLDDQLRANDLVNRNFTAHRPNQLWVADFTYTKTLSGWVYTAFIIDVFARVIVG